MRNVQTNIQRKYFKNFNCITRSRWDCFKGPLSTWFVSKSKEGFALYWLLLCAFITFIVYCPTFLWRSAKPLWLVQKQGWILIKLSQIDTEQLNLIRPLVLKHTQRAFSALIPVSDKISSYIWWNYQDKNHHLSTYYFYVRRLLLYFNPRAIKKSWEEKVR